MLCVICSPPSLPQVLNRFRLCSGGEGAASGELQRRRRVQCEGRGEWKGCPPPSIHLYPPHCSGPTGRPPRDMETVPWSLLLLLLLQPQSLSNAMWVTSVPRAEATGPSLAWGPWPWVECLHLGPWLWKKTLRKAVCHWAGLSTVSSWNRGTPKVFCVSDANLELSRFWIWGSSAPKHGARCLCHMYLWLMPSQTPAPHLQHQACLACHRLISAAAAPASLAQGSGQSCWGIFLIFTNSLWEKNKTKQHPVAKNVNSCTNLYLKRVIQQKRNHAVIVYTSC